MFLSTCSKSRITGPEVTNPNYRMSKHATERFYFSHRARCSITKSIQENKMQQADCFLKDNYCNIRFPESFITLYPLQPYRRQHVPRLTENNLIFAQDFGSLGGCLC